MSANKKQRDFKTLFFLLSNTIDQNELIEFFSDPSNFFDDQWYFFIIKALYFHSCEERKRNEIIVIFQFLKFLSFIEPNLHNIDLQRILLILDLEEFKGFKNFHREI